jgi:hypothetical protein
VLNAGSKEPWQIQDGLKLQIVGGSTVVAYGRDSKIYKLEKQGDKMELEELKITFGEA